MLRENAVECDTGCVDPSTPCNGKCTQGRRRLKHEENPARISLYIGFPWQHVWDNCDVSFVAISVSPDGDECVYDNVLPRFKFAVELFEDGSAGLLDRSVRGSGCGSRIPGGRPVFYTGAIVSQESLSAGDIRPSQRSSLLGQGRETEEADDHVVGECNLGYCRRGNKCCLMAYDNLLGFVCPTDINYCA